jgi:hypothetical protein
MCTHDRRVRFDRRLRRRSPFTGLLFTKTIGHFARRQASPNAKPDSAIAYGLGAMSEPGKAERALSKVGRWLDRRLADEPKGEPPTPAQKRARRRFGVVALTSVIVLGVVVPVVASTSAEVRDSLVAVGGIAVFVATALSTSTSLRIARHTTTRPERAALRDLLEGVTWANEIAAEVQRGLRDAEVSGDSPERFLEWAPTQQSRIEEGRKHLRDRVHLCFDIDDVVAANQQAVHRTLKDAFDALQRAIGSATKVAEHLSSVDAEKLEFAYVRSVYHSAVRSEGASSSEDAAHLWSLATSERASRTLEAVCIEQQHRLLNRIRALDEI